MECWGQGNPLQSPHLSEVLIAALTSTFRLLICDLDGTLISSADMWFEAATRCVRRYYEHFGLEGPLPTRAITDSMIGEPPGAAFARLLPTVTEPDLERLETYAREEEARLLSRDRGTSPYDLALPGVREVLAAFRAGGGQVAVASNCDERYLNVALPAAGLTELIDFPLCITSELHTKAAMVERALELASTRRALMVGDRAFDADAAAAHGVPFLARGAGYASNDRDHAAIRGAETTFTDWHEMPAHLTARHLCLVRLLTKVFGKGYHSLRVLGPSGAGRTLLAEELREISATFGSGLEVEEGAADGGHREGEGRVWVTRGEQVSGVSAHWYLDQTRITFPELKPCP